LETVEESLKKLSDLELKKFSKAITDEQVRRMQKLIGELPKRLETNTERDARLLRASRGGFEK